MATRYLLTVAVIALAAISQTEAFGVQSRSEQVQNFIAEKKKKEREKFKNKRFKNRGRKQRQHEFKKDHQIVSKIAQIIKATNEIEDLNFQLSLLEGEDLNSQFSFLEGEEVSDDLSLLEGEEVSDDLSFLEDEKVSDYEEDPSLEKNQKTKKTKNTIY